MAVAVGIMGSLDQSGGPRTELKGFCIVLSIFYMIFSIMIFGSGMAAYRYGQNDEHVDSFDNIVFKTPGGPNGYEMVSGISRDGFMTYAYLAIVGGLFSLGISLVFFNGLVTRNMRKCKLWIKVNLSLSMLITIVSLYRVGHGVVNISLLAVAIFVFNLVCVAVVSTYVIDIEYFESKMLQQQRISSKSNNNKGFVINIKKKEGMSLPATHKV